jgi:hypothetical protein
MAQAKIDYDKAAALLQTTGATLAEVALQTGAKNANSLRVGLARRGVTATFSRMLRDSPNGNGDAALPSVADSGEKLRRKLAADLIRTVDALERIQPGATLEALRERLQVMEPLARSAKIVHGWGDGDGDGGPVDSRFLAAIVINPPPDATSAPQ